MLFCLFRHKEGAHHLTTFFLLDDQSVYRLLPVSISRWMIISRANLIVKDGLSKIFKNPEHIFIPLRIVRTSL